MRATIQLIIFTGLFVLTTFAEAKGVGMVLDVRGQVIDESGGKKRALDITDAVLPGARITIPKEGELSFVFYPTRTMYAVTGPSVLVVDDKTIKSEQGLAPKQTRLPEDKAQVAQSYLGRVVPAAMVMKGVSTKVRPPALLSPLEGETMLSDRPNFVWEAAAGSGPLQFELREGETVLHTASVTSEKLELPANLVLVPGHRYQWSLTISGPDARTSRAIFSTATSAQVESLRKLTPSADAPPSEWVFYGMALEKVGAVSDARLVWKKLAKTRPDAGALSDLAQ